MSARGLKQIDRTDEGEEEHVEQEHAQHDARAEIAHDVVVVVPLHSKIEFRIEQIGWKQMDLRARRCGPTRTART